MKIRNLLLIPLFALGLLSGCSPKVEVFSTEDILEEASRFGSLLVNGKSGVTYPDRAMDVKLSLGDHLIGSRTVTVKNVLLEKEGEKVDIVVAVSYSVNEESEDLWKITEKKPDADHDRLVPEFPRVAEPDYVSVLTATFKLYYEEVEEGEEVVEAVDETELKVSWNVYHRALQVPIIETTIGDFRKEVVKVKTSDWVRLRGKLTTYFEEGTSSEDTHIYAGAFIADGDRAIMLYAGQMSRLWFDDNGPVFAIGDTIEVVAQYAPYNGLAEIKPNTMEKVVDPTIADSVDLTFTDPATQWNKTYLKGHDGRMCKFNNLVFKSANLKTLTEHGEIKFTAQGTNVEVKMYVSYHVGTIEKQKIHNMVATWTAGVTKINYHGILSWFDNPQLGPTNANGITVVS